MDTHRDHDDENASLIGVSLDELGRPLVETTHRDGRTDRHPLDESTEWPAGVPRPDSWKHRGGALVEEPRAGLTRAQRVEQSVRVEAALVKHCSTNTGLGITRESLPRILAEVFKAMGHGWEGRVKELSYDGQNKNREHG